MSFELIKQAILFACPNLNDLGTHIFLMTSAHHVPIETTSQVVAAASHGAITLSTYNPSETSTSTPEFSVCSVEPWVALLQKSPAIATFVRSVASSDVTQNEYSKNFAHAVLREMERGNESK